MSLFKKFNNLFFSVLLLFVLSACAVSTGQAINSNNVSSIQRGVTTEADIRRMFGEPTGVRQNARSNLRILTYERHNDEEIRRGATGLAGGLIGGLIGHQIGGGTGQDIATTVGAAGGAALGAGMIDTREEYQRLEVSINNSTGRVVDYSFEQRKSRDPGMRFNQGVGKL